MRICTCIFFLAQGHSLTTFAQTPGSLPLRCPTTKKRERERVNPVIKCTHTHSQVQRTQRVNLFCCKYLLGNKPKSFYQSCVCFLPDLRGAKEYLLPKMRVIFSPNLQPFARSELLCELLPLIHGFHGYSESCLFLLDLNVQV